MSQVTFLWKIQTGEYAPVLCYLSHATILLVYYWYNITKTRTD